MAGYDPNEPRDKGKWATGGAGMIAGTIESTPAEDQAARHEAIVKAVNDAAAAQGFDPRKIIVTTQDSTFELNGKQMYAAGTAYRDTGNITIHDTSNTHLTSAYVPNLVAHEIMHQKFNVFLQDYQNESDAMRKDPDYVATLPQWSAPEADGTIHMLNSGSTDTFMKPDGTLTEPYASRYPIYQDHVTLMEGTNSRPDLYDKMAKEDGCTPYSKEWWDSYQASKSPRETAYHETLAEMARLKTEDRANKQAHADNIAYIKSHGGTWTDEEEKKWQADGKRLTAPPTAKKPDAEGRRFLTGRPSKDWEALYKAVNQHWNKVSKEGGPDWYINRYAPKAAT